MSIRFGVALHVPATRRRWVDKCRRAEALGYDTISVGDHLGMPAPFPALVLAAEATERVRLGTYMLNANFYRPALAARDIASTDLFTDGRLELGLGAGHARAEFEAAGIAYASGAERVEALEQMVSELRRLFGTHGQVNPVQHPGPPLMIGGRGNRLLSLAAREADIISFNGASTSRHQLSGLPTFASADAVAERVQFARIALGDRRDVVEFNNVVPAIVVTDNYRAGLEKLAHFAPELSPEDLAAVPGLLVGTAVQIADKLRQN
ncbi:TIGR03621 family F420-dependent LLM class oxidoreductase [Kribbella sp. NPDC049584]|uniref:TIGR03621 family F420-dependent LLM class oxidoreductase n=1 Tax=Kribbella sp. NPDC049584 TaxID=3154833 RepID=UPI003412B248